MTAENVFVAVDSYFSMPLSTLQTAANARSPVKNNKNEPSATATDAPAFAIPEDCFEQHVLAFLTTKEVGLSGLVEEDFDELQESIFRRDNNNNINNKKNL